MHRGRQASGSHPPESSNSNRNCLNSDRWAGNLSEIPGIQNRPTIQKKRIQLANHCSGTCDRQCQKSPRPLRQRDRSHRFGAPRSSDRGSYRKTGCPPLSIEYFEARYPLAAGTLKKVHAEEIDRSASPGRQPDPGEEGRQTGIKRCFGEYVISLFRIQIKKKNRSITSFVAAGYSKGFLMVREPADTKFARPLI